MLEIVKIHGSPHTETNVCFKVNHSKKDGAKNVCDNMRLMRFLGLITAGSLKLCFLLFSLIFLSAVSHMWDLP